MLTFVYNFVVSLFLLSTSERTQEKFEMCWAAFPSSFLLVNLKECQKNVNLKDHGTLCLHCSLLQFLFKQSSSLVYSVIYLIFFSFRLLRLCQLFQHLNWRFGCTCNAQRYIYFFCVNNHLEDHVTINSNQTFF